MDVGEGLNVKDGITSNGRTAVRNDQNSDITLEKETGNQEGYTVRHSGGDLVIYASKGGIVADNYIAKYNKETDTWDFNATGLTKNGVPLTSGNDFKYDFTPDSAVVNHENGVMYLPNGLMIQFMYSRAQSKTYKWPVPFTEFVTAVNAGVYDNAADTWNISIYYGLKQVEVGQPSVWHEATFIAIGK